MKKDDGLLSTIDALPADERAFLANHIWQSLNTVDAQMEEAWVREADRRWKEFRKGTIGSISLSEFRRRHIK
jgi:putative addiction module component (TIGR02574 family)